MSFGSGISWPGTQHRQGFWLRINCSQMKLPDFESPSGDSLSKSANFGLSKWIFYVKNHPSLSNFFFIEEYQFRCTFFVKMFDEMSLNGNPKFGTFIWLQLILGQKPCLCWVPDLKIPLPKLIYYQLLIIFQREFNWTKCTPFYRESDQTIKNAKISSWEFNSEIRVLKLVLRS